jgi:ADP-heptose:LPS heptosyltransferase
LQKFLIIQTAFIGDVVLATPLVEKLHVFFPEAQIDFLVRKGNEGLFSDHPFIRNVLIWEKRKNKKRNLFRVLSVIRKNRYDKVINVQRFFATGILTAFSGAKEAVGFDKNPLSFLFSRAVKHVVGGTAAVHETERNLKLILDFTDISIYKPKLYPSQKDFDCIDKWTADKFITISPASVWFTKQFPGVKWETFINSVPLQYKIYLLGGPGDISFCNEIKKSCNRPGVEVLAGLLSFLESAALMTKSLMNYVNDSAPMHFASAVNAPVTAVYCSTIPGFGFGPLSDVRHIIEINQPLYCRPCGLHGYSSCPEKHFKCAFEIENHQLTDTLPDRFS